jgi:protein-disulfide isomerase-like protein with CxxC motif
LQAVLTPIMSNQAAVEQALTLPPEQRLVQLAEVGGFYDFFAARGLSEDQARSCLADAAVYTRIAENSTRQSEELEITGTPTFLVNGRKVEANSWAQLEPILQRAGAR